MEKSDLGREEEELPVEGNYSATEKSLGATHGTSHRPVTPELDKERLSTAAELHPCPCHRQGLPLGTQPEAII